MQRHSFHFLNDLKQGLRSLRRQFADKSLKINTPATQAQLKGTAHPAHGYILAKEASSEEQRTKKEKKYRKVWKKYLKQ